MDKVFVEIKEETFEELGDKFLYQKGFKPKTNYVFVATMAQKVLIADQESGEMIELFPRNCLYKG